MKTILALITLLGLTALTLANHINIYNNKTSIEPITVVYKFAHKDIGGVTQLSNKKESVTLKPGELKKVAVHLNGYQLAGIVPLSINQLIIPKKIREFAKIAECSAATDKDKPMGLLKLTLTSPEHINCISQ